MSNKQTIFLVSGVQRQYAKQCIDAAPENWMVTLQEKVKKREQEERYHAMVGDIARQCRFMDAQLSKEDWKRLLIDAFARVKAAEGNPLKGYGRILPSLDGSGFVQLGVQSRDFSKSIASEFIEYLYAWGAEQEPPVMWSEPVLHDEERFF